jgi:hypothetical protein
MTDERLTEIAREHGAYDLANELPAGTVWWHGDPIPLLRAVQQEVVKQIVDEYLRKADEATDLAERHKTHLASWNLAQCHVEQYITVANHIDDKFGAGEARGSDPEGAAHGEPPAPIPFGVRRATTPEAQAIWDNVSKAAEHVPLWAKAHIEKQVKQQVDQLRRTRMSDYWDRGRQRRAMQQAEDDGRVADSLDVRKAIMQRVKTGEITFAQGQAELARIKREAEANGQVTRDQAYQGH